MLVLSRKQKESIRIGNDITVIVQRIAGNRVSLTIDAPRDVVIRRGELQPQGPTPNGCTLDVTAGTQTPSSVEGSAQTGAA